MKRTTQLTIAVLVITFSFTAQAYSEEIGPGVDRQAVEALRTLKEKDPVAYQREMAERKARLRQRLQTLRQENPERFQEIMERHRKTRRERFEYLKRTDPEKFQELLKRHQIRLEERLQRLKENDPERYERIMHRREEHKREWAGQHQERFKNQQGRHNGSHVGGRQGGGGRRGR